MNRSHLYLFRSAILSLIIFCCTQAFAQVTITEDFDYGTSAGNLTGQNGGSGFSSGWTVGTNAYTPVYSVTGSNASGCFSVDTQTITTTPGPNNALGFNGSPGYVEAPINTSLMGPQPTTIEFWAKAVDVGGSFAININGANVAIRFGGGGVQIEHYGGSAYHMGRVNDECWHHYAFTWDGTTAYGYVDGKVPPNPSLTYPFPATIPGTLYLGGYGQYRFDGTLDEVRIWNVQRSQAEIQNNLYNELTGSEPNLVAYYNFNQGTPNGNNTGMTTIPDLSVNQLDGILRDFALTGSTSNFVPSGALIRYPEINLVGNGNDIADGATSVTTTTGTDFGSLTIGSSATNSFTIQNTGDEGLRIFSISLDGANPAEFGVSGITLPMTLAVGSSVTFAVSFSATTAGTRSAIVHVSNDDCNEADYDFAVRGETVYLPSDGGSVLGSATVCTGANSAVLSVTNQTGTVQKWQSALTDDFASPTDIDGSAGLSSLTVTNLTQTTYYRAVVQSGTNSSTFSSAGTVTIGPSITASISGNLTICAGQSTTLLASGGSTYEWSNGVVTASNPVSPTTTTSYTVVGVSGSCSSSATATVIVNPIPAILITPSAITANGGEALTLTASGADSYTWSTPANTTTITVSPKETTTYSVTGSSSGCVSSASATVTVLCGEQVMARAISTTVTSQLGPGNCSVTIRGTGYGTGYTITGPDGYVFSAVYRKVGSYTINGLSVTQPGTYTLTVSYIDACGRISTDTMTYNVTGTACR